jgi:hypothetical protein
MWYGEVHGRTMLGGARWLRIVSLMLFVIGLAIRGTAIFTLGRSFSTNVAIHATQIVHKTGLFRWVRHPSYSGIAVDLRSDRVGPAELGEPGDHGGISNGGAVVSHQGGGEGADGGVRAGILTVFTVD